MAYKNYRKKIKKRGRTQKYCILKIRKRLPKDSVTKPETVTDANFSKWLSGLHPMPEDVEVILIKVLDK